MNRSRCIRLLPLSVLILLAAASCGGGGASPGPNTQEIWIPVADDGVVTPTWLHPWDDPRSPLSAVWVGDDAQDAACRGLFRFPLADVPAGANVVGAVLRLAVSERLGNPGESYFEGAGDLGIMEWHRLPGTPLALADFDAPSEAHDPEGDLPMDIPNHVWGVGVLEPVLSALADGDTHLKLRAQYTTPTDDDGAPDQIRMGTRGTGSGAILQIVIRP